MKSKNQRIGKQSTHHHQPGHVQRYPVPPTDEDIDALLAEAGRRTDAQDLQDAVKIVIKTCLRRKELCNLRWAHINFDKRCMSIASQKTAHVRSVPFVEEVLELLLARRERQPDSEYVFGNSPLRAIERVAQQLRVLSARACKRQLTLQLLRHAFMSRWVKSGGSPFALYSIAGYESFPSKFRTILSVAHQAEFAAHEMSRMEW